MIHSPRMKCNCWIFISERLHHSAIQPQRHWWGPALMKGLRALYRTAPQDHLLQVLCCVGGTYSITNLTYNASHLQGSGVQGQLPNYPGWYSSPLRVWLHLALTWILGDLIASGQLAVCQFTTGMIICPCFHHQSPCVIVFHTLAL